MNIKEDLRDWLVDNWIAIEDSVDSVLTSCNKEFLMKGERFELSNVVDRDNLVNKIAENLKTGILNVVDTYEEPKHEWIRAEEDLPGPFSTVLLSIKDTKSGNTLVATGAYNHHTEEWEVDAQMPDHKLCAGEIIETWQHLPESWKGESNNEESAITK